MYVVIVANAPGLNLAPYHQLLTTAERLIAADGGGTALFTHGYTPHLLIGDLDSITPEALAAYQAQGVAIERHRPDKDETDLELALLAAVNLGASRIDIIGALGGRWDQSLANVTLLGMAELRGRRVRLLDHPQQIWLVTDVSVIPGAVGDTVSLLPFGGDAHGITTEGLAYPLHNGTLYYDRARGVSNVITATPAQVQVRDGALLIVWTARAH
ncbi:thiamine diphosphokinase [Chloroflexus aggregans]|uniref:Thiamine diphosphokinase n=1 Tax=Chloroflexus aggregans (strain MD-66 / DSM 9485) TaxID=326427 RepID=B8G3I8_CHLAD|nr:thiamine diphosphokinase [Chloroflexus aggregans]ACL23371.1 thiamine pyrophosphokinase [Chloroflexus aggregans DSM 9485]